jgi:outer membrane receptor protein involved in Fe transport
VESHRPGHRVRQRRRRLQGPLPVQVNNGFANLISNYMSISNPDLKPETSETFEGASA